MRKYVPFALIKTGELFYTITNEGAPAIKHQKMGSLDGHPITIGNREMNAVVLGTGVAAWHAPTNAVIRESDLSDSQFKGEADIPDAVKWFKAMPPNVQPDGSLSMTVTSDKLRPKNEEDLAVWYTPDAIRSHFDGESGAYAEWVNAASHDELIEVGRSILSNDHTWEDFHDNIIMELDIRMRAAEEAKHRKRIDEEGR